MSASKGNIPPADVALPQAHNESPEAGMAPLRTAAPTRIRRGVPPRAQERKGRSARQKQAERSLRQKARDGVTPQFLHRMCNPSSDVALDFLTWVGLAAPSAVCPAGHQWWARTQRKRVYFLCCHRGPGTVKRRPQAASQKLLAQHRRGPNPLKYYQEKAKLCGHNQPWHDTCPLAHALPVLSPDHLVELIHGCAAHEPVSRMHRRTGLGRQCIRACYEFFRACQAMAMSKDAPVKLGGRDSAGRLKPVVVDEGYMRKMLRQAAGFRGRPSVGLRAWMLVAAELDRKEMPRRETGNCVCVLIPNRKATTLQAALRPVLHNASLVWSDGHPGYNFLTADGHQHEAVIHTRGEFGRLRGHKRNFKKQSNKIDRRRRVPIIGRGRALLQQLRRQKQATPKLVRLHAKTRGVGVSGSLNGSAG